MQIPEVLEVLGLTSAELSRRIGVSRGAISQWKTAKRIPKWRQLQIEGLSDRLRAGPECDKLRVRGIAQKRGKKREAA